MVKSLPGKWWHASTHPRLAALYERHQRAVSRLPIPRLEDTCARYLSAARPLQTPYEHEKTREVVNAFLAGEGVSLHAQLVAEDESRATAAPDSSYMESLWYRAAYLGPRDPIPINANPGLVLQPPSWSAESAPLWRAATLLAASAAWRKRLVDGALPAPTTPSGDAMCMGMYPMVLGSCRRPEMGCDRIHHEPEAAHAAVHAGGEWFVLPLLDEHGAPLPPATLLAAMQQLPPADSTGRPHSGIGAFTAEERDSWATTRAQLTAASETNRTSLTAIESAAVVMILDPAQPSNLSETSRLVLAGDARKRWFDKMAFLVFANGVAGVNFEHSPLDGAQVVSFLNEVCGATADLLPPPPDAVGPPLLAAPKKLDWELSAELAQQAQQAALRFDAFSESMDLHAITISAIGGKWARSLGVGLDGVVQLALQLGYAAAAAPPLPQSVYEACSTQLYRAGRTECIRSVTEESAALSKLIVPLISAAVSAGDEGAAAAAAGSIVGGLGEASTKELAAKVAMALNAHRAVVRSCQKGQGHERHLRALLEVARTRGHEPALCEPRAPQTRLSQTLFRFVLSCFRLASPFRPSVHPWLA
jgi:hypothetical protein